VKKLKKIIAWVAKNPLTTMRAILAMIIGRRIFALTKVEHPSVVRSYKNDVLEPLEKFKDNWNLKEIGKSEEGFPIMALEPKDFNQDKENILITAGVHGSEPAGLFSLLKNKELLSHSDKNVYIIPCVNPWGFEYNKRYTKNEVDVNRQFKEDTENSNAQCVMSYLKGLNLKFEYTIDLHETTQEDIRNEGFIHLLNSKLPIEDGAFIYQTVLNKEKELGSHIVKRLEEEEIKVTSWKEIWEEPCINGTVTYPEARVSIMYSTSGTLEDFCANHLTESAITAESMGYESLEKRMKMHKIVMETALNK